MSENNADLPKLGELLISRGSTRRLVKVTQEASTPFQRFQVQGIESGKRSMVWGYHAWNRYERAPEPDPLPKAQHVATLRAEAKQLSERLAQVNRELAALGVCDG